MWGSPGSGSMYSRACRQSLQPNCHPCGASPTSYFAEKPGCRPCLKENLHAPFGSSAERKLSWGCDPDIPGPGLYYPKKPCCVSQGTYKLCKPTHIPFKRVDDCLEEPGFIVPPDPWSKNSAECFEPRVCREKWVLEPKDDLWSTQPRFVNPDLELYDTREIRTSQNPGVSCTKFGNPPPVKASKCSIALNDYECSAGDYNLSGPCCQKGGAFLSKTDCPDRSIPRYLEDVYNKGIKSCYPGPGSYKPWNQPSIAITSPFKSKSPLPRYKCSGDSGPGPNEYFKQKYCLEDLDPCDDIYTFIRRYQPSKAPFLTSDARFPENCSKIFGSPPPTAYNIRGFAQELLIRNCKRRAAIENPKLGFGSGCCQRPPPRPEEFFDLDSQYCNYEFQERCWRNLRPTTRPYTCYHGPPSKNGGPSPSAYDTRDSYNYIKGKKDFWDPRKVTGIGFNNSGCNSGPGNFFNVDFDIPGPGTYKAEIPKCPDQFSCSGVGMTQESRDKPLFPVTDGPGPGLYKPHDKYGSSVWRGTHLGSFNVDLKNICPTTPSAGGYHANGPIDEIADKCQGIVRDL